MHALQEFSATRHVKVSRGIPVGHGKQTLCDLPEDITGIPLLCHVSPRDASLHHQIHVPLVVCTHPIVQMLTSIAAIRIRVQIVAEPKGKAQKAESQNDAEAIQQVAAQTSTRTSRSIGVNLTFYQIVFPCSMVVLVMLSEDGFVGWHDGVGLL